MLESVRACVHVYVNVIVCSCDRGCFVKVYVRAWMLRESLRTCVDACGCSFVSASFLVYVCARVRACVRACALVRARVPASVLAYVCASSCAFLRACIRWCVRACVRVCVSTWYVCA